jgi:hypothetical protein
MTGGLLFTFAKNLQQLKFSNQANSPPTWASFTSLHQALRWKLVITKVGTCSGKKTISRTGFPYSDENRYWFTINVAHESV